MRLAPPRSTRRPVIGRVTLSASSESENASEISARLHPNSLAIGPKKTLKVKPTTGTYPMNRPTAATATIHHP
jgi:hypothetical protein